jgi:hypothetical protein
MAPWRGRIPEGAKFTEARGMRHKAADASGQIQGFSSRSEFTTCFAVRRDEFRAADKIVCATMNGESGTG